MKKIIASLNGFTLSLIPVVTFANTYTHTDISNLQIEKQDLSNMPWVAPIKNDEDKKLISNEAIINLISQIDLQTLNEALEIIKEKQDLKDNNKKIELYLSKISEKISFLAAMVNNVKFSLIKILKEIAILYVALCSVKQEFEKISLNFYANG